MQKRIAIVLALTVVVVLGFEPVRSAYTIALTEAEVELLNARDVSTMPSGDIQKRDNTFVRVIKAPFKVIGRLFGRGGKKDDNKLRRLSEKDAKRFETAQFTRIIDATSAPTAQPSNKELSAAEHLELGRSWLNSSNLNEAIGELSVATSMDPKLAEAFNLLGVAYHRKHLVQLAREAFETALKLDKKNAQTLNNLGYLFYSQAEYEKAHDRFKKAAQLAPDDARILNNLALAQSQLGKFDEAFKNFVRAGGELDGRLNIANRLEIAGRTEEALKHYEAARFVAATEQKANPKSLVITVQMEIKNGRVTYAAVENRRPGMEAYEASALRIARQRRYPSYKNGQESFVVRLQPLPAS
ncbi:MAG TPA: tetratricopeptide repeat protein [Pyrinomonadaceae bacterium]|nr:tetratricopeptide repeat protein [Pyrinomonadaceae bacterium]